MRDVRLLLIGLLLAGCQQAAPQGSSTAPANSVAKARDTCEPPRLQLSDGGWPFESTLLDETMWNFAKAYRKACGKKLFKARSLMDPEAADSDTLFLLNAPEANIASIYLSETDGKRMVLEYAFVTPDGQSHVPPVEDLEEAIHCKVIGATPEEEERIGRCLPD